MRSHRSLVDDSCTLDADDKVQGISCVHRCHGRSCVVEMSQHLLFVDNTDAMHVQSLDGLEAHAILGENQPFR